MQEKLESDAISIHCNIQYTHFVYIIEIFQIALGSDKEAIAEKDYLKYSKDDL